MGYKKHSLFTYLLILGAAIYFMFFVVQESELHCQAYVCTLKEASLWNKKLTNKQIDISENVKFEIDYRYAWWNTLHPDQYFIMATTKDNKTDKFFKNPIYSREEAAEILFKLQRILIRRAGDIYIKI